MTPVKRQEGPPTLAGRIHILRTILGWPRKPLTQAELQARLQQRYGDRAPSLSTVKRWEQKAYGKISGKDASMVADLAGAKVEWVLRGKGQGPAARPAAPSGKAPTGGDSSGVAEWGAPTGFDLAEEIVHHPDQFARRMEKWATNIGVDQTIAWMDDAEQILRQNGLDFTTYFATLRAGLRAKRQAAGGASA